MQGVYTVHVEVSSLGSAKTLLLIEAPSTGIVEILSASLTNANQTTLEQLSAGLFRVTSKGSPASGTSPDVAKTESGGSNASTLYGNLSGEPSAYDSAPIHKEGFLNVSGYHYDPVPEERPTVPPSGLIGLRLLTVPSNAFKAVATITFREIK